MNLAALETALHQKYFAVGPKELKWAEGTADYQRRANMGYVMYTFPVDDLAQMDGFDVSHTARIDVKVYDLGQPYERAVLDQAAPRDFQQRPADTTVSDADAAFQEEVETWLAANVPATMPVWLVLEVNAAKRFAIVRVFQAQGSTPETYADQKYFVYQTPGGTVKFGELVE